MKLVSVAVLTILATACSRDDHDTVWWNNRATIIDLTNQLELARYRASRLPDSPAPLQTDSPDLAALDLEVKSLRSLLPALHHEVDALTTGWDQFRRDMLASRRSLLPHLPMTSQSIRSFSLLPFLTSAALLSIASCGENSELVKKHGEQQAEIARLRGEIALIEERLKSLPPDRSAELESALEASRRLEAEHTILAAEVSELEARRDSLKRDYEEYRAKYAVR